MLCQTFLIYNIHVKWKKSDQNSKVLKKTNKRDKQSVTSSTKTPEEKKDDLVETSKTKQIENIRYY